MSINLLFIIKIIFEGIVEGVTEFLPISSTGHMIIFGSVIGFKGGVKPISLYSDAYVDMFEVVIQLGAILAIVVLYWDKIVNALRPSNIFPSAEVRGESYFSRLYKMPGFKFWFNIVIGCIPAGILGVLFEKKIKSLLFKPAPVALALIFGAVWMIYAENKYRKNSKVKRVEDITVFQAFIIGCFQCLAVVWPGMSRSASTIIGAWIVGVATVAGAEFSFFVAIPLMIAASVFSLVKVNIALSSIQIVGLGIGFLVAFVVALFVVEGFVNFLKKKPMRVFAVYRLFLGTIVLILGFAHLIS